MPLFETTGALSTLGDTTRTHEKAKLKTLNLWIGYIYAQNKFRGLCMCVLIYVFKLMYTFLLLFSSLNFLEFSQGFLFYFLMHQQESRKIITCFFRARIP